MRRAFELEPEEEKVFLAGVIADSREKEPLSELAALVRTAGGEVVGSLTQRYRRINPTCYIGKGKTEELANLTAEKGADLIVFDNDLTAAQVRNIEKATKKRVIDRSELILDIFARHARTRQAKLQVELAQLEYELPRLKRLWTHLSRMEGGIGTRGPGERQLEEDKRAIAKKITALRRELVKIEKRTKFLNKKREDEFTVSLVGYTNAGKSTLLNRLTNADVFTSEELFATLDTKTSLWELGDKRAFLSDTVGFIRDIPHHLIASFHTTLLQAEEADLLLHIVDASNPAAEQQIASVNKVMKSLGLDAKRVVLVLNKLDRLRDPVEIQILSRTCKVAVPVSAKTGEGIDSLAAVVSEIMEENWQEGGVTVPVGNGELLSRLYRDAVVLSKEVLNGKVRMHIKAHKRDIARLRNFPALEWLEEDE